MFVSFCATWILADIINIIKTTTQECYKTGIPKDKTTFTTGRGILTRVWTWQTPIWCRRGLHMNNYSFIGQYIGIHWMQWHLSDFIQGCIFQLKRHNFTKRSTSRQKTFGFWQSMIINELLLANKKKGGHYLFWWAN